MIRYEVEGGHLPVLICYPEAGQTLCTESGAMSWMSSNMKMDTNTGGGMKKVLGRMFTGESLFMNEYTAEKTSGMIAFASRFPGSIIPYQVTAGNSIIVQKNGFLAMEKGLDLSIYFQKKLGKGFFGGEGFILQKLQGNGLAFVHGGGTIVRRTLMPGQILKIDTGCLVAMTKNVIYDIQFVGGLKNTVFGGEGLFFATLTGPGDVWIQSLPFSKLADRIISAAPQLGNRSKDEGSILGGISNLFEN